MKKVLFLIHDLGAGGAERVLVNLVNYMDKSKYDITVMSLFDIGVNRQYLGEAIHYKYCFKKVFRGNSHIMKVFSPERLHRRFIHDHYDIEIAYLEGPCARIISGCKDANTKLVAWIHTELQTIKSASGGFRNVSEARQRYNRFDKVVAVSETVRAAFLKTIHSIGLTEVLYNTNDTHYIREQAKSMPDDSQFAIKNNEDLRVCAVGKLTKNKGFDRLLSAHKRLMDEGVIHKVYVLGAGEEQKKLEAKIKEYNVEQSFVLLGLKTDPYCYMSRCDVFVCSSHREGFSTATTEALILGTAVVSTNCSGAKEMLGDNNEYGIVVENSEEGIYIGLKRMLSDAKLLAHYKAMSKERGENFSGEKTTKAVEDMLEAL